MRPPLMYLLKVFLVAAVLACATLRADESAGKHAQKTVKMDFDDVVVKSQSRETSNIDTIGVIERERKAHSLYQINGDFTERVKSSLIELGDSL